LVQLEGNIIYSSSVQPLPIASNFIGGGVNAVLAGFGFLTIQNRTFSDVLQYVTVTTITNSDCVSRMPEFLQPEITDRIMCTFTRAGQGLCLGDTGGAVISGNAAIGIMSFGQACALGVPDGHTRISIFRSWILSVVE
jgi:Trypsin